MSNASQVSPVIAAARLAAPALSAAAERALTTAIVKAHALAWFVTLGPECARDTRRAAVLRWASRRSGVDAEAAVLADAGDPAEFSLDDVPALAARCRAGLDHDQDLLRAAQAVVLDECDDVLTSPRAGARSVARAERWRRHVLQAARDLARLEDRMVRHNLGLAVQAALARRGSGVPFEDLVQQGALGLLAAVRRFDPSRGLKFSTMAAWWIKHYVGRYVENNARTIRLPVWVSGLLCRVREAERALYSVETGPASVEQVAAHLGEDPRRLAPLMLADRPCASLDAPVRCGGTDGEDDPRHTLLSMHADDAPSAEDAVQARQRRTVLAAALRRALPADLADAAVAVHVDGEDADLVAELHGTTASAQRAAVVDAARDLPARLLRACM